MNATPTAPANPRALTLLALGDDTARFEVNGAAIELDCFDAGDCTFTVNVYAAGIVTLRNATGSCTIDRLIGQCVDEHGTDAASWGA